MSSILTMTFAAAALVSAAQRPNFDRAYSRPEAAVSSVAQAPGVVTSRDSAAGPAKFIWSPARNVPAAAGSTPESAARFYLEQHAAHYGVGGAALATVELQRIHDIGRGGIVAIFGQRVAGLPVENARVSVTMKRDLTLVALAGSVAAAIGPRGPASLTSFNYSAEEALEGAFADLFELNTRGSWRQDGSLQGADIYRLLPSAEAALGISLWAPSRAWQAWYAMPDGLVPAWKVEILATDAEGADASFEYVVSAADGSLLKRRNLTADGSATEGGILDFNYTVFAATTGLETPLDGPISDVTPHPTGNPDGTAPVFIPPVSVLSAGFGDPPLDPWLPNAAVETVGNNVDAYADLVAPDGLTPATADTRGTLTDPLEFGWVYDTAVGAAADEAQIKAAVVNLFYVNNWLHDYFYDSGFDEAAGNAQLDNFGRGGVDGDPLHAESDDYGGTNNANMSTPADGGSPRMQMYKWSGADDAYVRRTSPDPDTDFPAKGAAGFGPQTFDISGALVLWDDDNVNPIPPSTGGSETDGCQAPVPPTLVTGKVALVDRGGCTFLLKAQNATAAGAIGVVIANNVAGSVPPMGGGAGEPTVAALGITQAAGDTLKADLIGGPVQVDLHRIPGPNRSGSLDNQIVAHEWGHYFHHRQQACGTQQCGAQSEGWGDWVALHTTVEDGDNYGGVYGAAIYSTATFGPDYAYFGIRRFPYSTDFTKNGLTFRHISNGQALPPTPIFPNGIPNSEVHNAGEIWATMMHEAYVALLTDPVAFREGTPRLTFDEARRRIADYVVAGLQASPVDSTFTETRDSILAAAAAADPLDFLAIADAFATRGAGTCAVSPPRQSTDLIGVVEDFTLSGRLVVTNSPFADDVISCDNDGYLDATETGTLQIEVTNLGPALLTGAQVTVSSDNAHVTFPGGNSAGLTPIGFGESATANFELAADASTAALSTVTVTVTATHAQTCGGSVQMTRVLRLSADEFAANIDSVEANSTNWGQSGDTGLWSRVFTAGNTDWHGIDTGSPTDTRLESPPIQVEPSGNFILEFDHRYDFEFSGGIYWDGGVIEYSTDAGNTWDDLSDLVAVPYDGILTGDSGNPLLGRNAFAGQNAAYPAKDHLALDLGTQLAGQTVQFRFRIGTDAAVGGGGWDVDNIAVQNAVNHPFIGLGGDPGCASSLIFADGFETGSTSAWSSAVP